MIVGQLYESRGAAELCRYLFWLRLLSHPGDRMALCVLGLMLPRRKRWGLRCIQVVSSTRPDDSNSITLGSMGKRSPATMPAPPSSFRTNSPASP